MLAFVFNQLNKNTMICTYDYSHMPAAHTSRRHMPIFAFAIHAQSQIRCTYRTTQSVKHRHTEHPI